MPSAAPPEQAAGGAQQGLPCVLAPADLPHSDCLWWWVMRSTAQPKRRHRSQQHQMLMVLKEVTAGRPHRIKSPRHPMPARKQQQTITQADSRLALCTCLVLFTVCVSAPYSADTDTGAGPVGCRR